MGKALLVLVLGSGLILTKQLVSTQESEARTSKDQRAYQEEVIAREIAASAFNVGMGELRAFGEEVHAGTIALNGPNNRGRSGTYSTGRFTGGSYTVKAQLTSGHSVRVVATGTFGEASYTMHDEYRVHVLTAREGGIVDVSFIESMAGYCSAVYYQAYTLDMEEGEEPEPIMLFAPDNRDRSVARPARMIWVEPGTQMNFFIGVDKNCSTRPTKEMPTCQARAHARNNTVRLSDFDYIHSALVVSAGNLGEVEEDIWAYVEQKPGARDTWRIGWEDIHNTSWDNPTSTDPRNSLQGLKIYGYDGTGWPDANADGYRLLRDYGSRPDLSDQVIEVHVIRPSDAEYQETVDSYHDQQDECGEVEDEVPDLPDPTTEPDPDTDPDPDTTPDPDPNPTPDPDPEPEPEPDTDPDDDDNDAYNDYACSCTKNNTKNNKNPVLHRPPGNESNEQLLCLPDPATRTHLRQHNDIVLSCTVR
ncbi:hypothetical protein [Rubrivirga sp. SAORIC476]|uniref:hypothetical protein n=1 Tax=Rubrivirga sp. SAORIC476 TaxID=1961794 RepID=UPI0018E93F87|nr:hypothetical protein [Rubrivirga sp. SAORIC476]